jgi:hypothetical protein
VEPAVNQDAQDRLPPQLPHLLPRASLLPGTIHHHLAQLLVMHVDRAIRAPMVFVAVSGGIADQVKIIVQFQNVANLTAGVRPHHQPILRSPPFRPLQQ